jgi:hypothetical protein
MARLKPRPPENEAFFGKLVGFSACTAEQHFHHAAQNAGFEIHVTFIAAPTRMPIDGPGGDGLIAAP